MSNKLSTSKRWLKACDHVIVRDKHCSAVSGVFIKDKYLAVGYIVPRKFLTAKQQYDVDNLWLLSRREYAIKKKLERSISNSRLRRLSRSWWIEAIKAEGYEYHVS